MQTPVPRPEHPRPDLQRSTWLNLNGTWEFFETDAEVVKPPKDKFVDKITVPFCRESSLSGLNRKGFVKHVWYRKEVTLPADWKAARTLLHIGACDWRTTVTVNGVQVGTAHFGGSAPISADITSQLKPGPNEIIVHAFDDTRSGIQALGKQCPEPNSYGCLYTRTTGIWQTVWVEGVGENFVKSVETVCDLKSRKVDFKVNPDKDLERNSIRVKVYDGSKLVADKLEKPGSKQISVTLENPKLWSPKSAFLYRTVFTIENNGVVLDKVDSYFGFRTVSIDGHRILINGEPIFQRLILDQGFYPDGVWTAPSDAALKADIEMSMAAGFNGARLHQKVFEPRFLYWADKKGYLVWGEFPCWGLNYKDKKMDGPVKSEWAELIERDFSHPSIIGWCPFNETPTEAIPIQNEVVALTRKLDPTRPVLDTSGWSHGIEKPMVMDAHDYDQNPETFKKRWIEAFGPNTGPDQYRKTVYGNVPFMVSEYGGIGWNTEGGWGYGNSPKTLDEFYARFKGLADAQLDNPRLFGFCYTQLTDVEQEKNGLYTYDRKPKFDVAKLKKALNRPAAIEKGVPLAQDDVKLDWEVILGSAKDGAAAKQWSFTETAPVGNWTAADFNDTKWSKSLGGFGDKGQPDSQRKHVWESKDIWMRQSFEWDGKPFGVGVIATFYDNTTEVYLNGKLIWQSKEGAWNNTYELFQITTELRQNLKKGQNIVAVHCHQDTGGQFIDVGLMLARVRKG